MNAWLLPACSREPLFFSQRLKRKKRHWLRLRWVSLRTPWKEENISVPKTPCSRSLFVVEADTKGGGGAWGYCTGMSHRYSQLCGQLHTLGVWSQFKPMSQNANQCCAWHQYVSIVYVDVTSMYMCCFCWDANKEVRLTWEQCQHSAKH